jgi:hypothetical protein
MLALVACGEAAELVPPVPGEVRLELITAPTEGIARRALAPLEVRVIVPQDVAMPPRTVLLYARRDDRELYLAERVTLDRARFEDLRLDAGRYAFVARIEGVTEVESAPLTILPAPEGLRFLVQPTHTTLRERIAPAVEVEIVDDRGARVLLDGLGIDLLWRGGGGRSSSALTVSGVAVFPELIADVAREGATLEAHCDGLGTTVSAPFTIFPLPPARLAWVIPPAPWALSERTYGFSVEALDADGARVRDQPLRFDLTLAEGTGRFEGETRVTVTDGHAELPDLRYVIGPGIQGSEWIRLQVSVGPTALLSDPIEMRPPPPSFHRVRCGGNGEPNATGPASIGGDRIVLSANCGIGGEGLYLHEIGTGITTLLDARAPAAPVIVPDRDPDVSADGSHMIFTADGPAYLTVDESLGADAFVRDFAAGTVELLGGAQAMEPSRALRGTISPDGSEAIFVRGAVDAPAYYLAIAGSAPTLIAQDQSSPQAMALGLEPQAARSADGAFIVFTAVASLVPGDDGGINDLYLYDVGTGELGVVGRGPNDVASEHPKAHPFLDATGSRLVYSTREALVADDTNDATDVYLLDLVSGVISRLSTDASGQQALIARKGSCASPDSWPTGFSSDGRFVLFDSCADNLGALDANRQLDVFIKDLDTGAVERVNINPGGGDLIGRSYSLDLSSDGRRVVLATEATNVGTIDTNGVADVYWVENPLLR